MNQIESIISKTAVVTDNIPTIDSSDRIREERASLLLLDLFLGKHQGVFMTRSSNVYNCDRAEKDGYFFNCFEINTKQIDFVKGIYPSINKCSTHYPSFSLYSLLQKEARHKGLAATENHFGIKPNQPFGSFKLNKNHFVNVPFSEDLYNDKIKEGFLYEEAIQWGLHKWYTHKFPNKILQNEVTGFEKHPANNFYQIFDFVNSCNQTMMQAIKIYLKQFNGTLVKTYLPLTQWFWKEHNCDFRATVGLPDKQIFMHLPQIAQAQTVVICPTMEDAVALQKNTTTDEIAFTAFIASKIGCANVDFEPLKNKKVHLLISNRDGISLAEAYEDAEGMYCTLREEGFSEISFIQREVIYPSYRDVTDIAGLIATHRKQKPIVVEESVQEFSETEFLERLEAARAEIARKVEQSKDLPFWQKSNVESTEPTSQNSIKISEKMVLRPFLIRGETILIESTPGMGKSCFTTALCARIAGSNAPFLEERCFTRCSTPSGRGNKVAYLVFDADGESAITEHRNDFARNIGENDINFIQLNMAGKSIDYSKEANYNDFVELLSDIRDNHGVKGQPVDVLVIDTLLAFTHNKSNASFEVFTKLNREFPDMALVVIHHLNLNNNTYGGTLATMGPRAIIKLFRTNEQTESIGERKPTLTDPFTIEIDKFNTNKIPEDGESFEVVLDENNNFVVVNSIRSQKEMRKLLLSGYEKYYKLTQDEIGKLFDVSSRTIRNWLDEKGE